MTHRPKVFFISYSHDSDQHRDRVLGVSERLRRDGYDTRLDQYVNGSPPKGWPLWMLDRLDEAESVLVVCTETYYRRFRGHEQPDRGKGVVWEGALITQELYDSRSCTLKFVPVLFDAGDAHFIPELMRSRTHFYKASTRNPPFLTGEKVATQSASPGLRARSVESHSPPAPQFTERGGLGNRQSPPKAVNGCGSVSRSPTASVVRHSGVPAAPGCAS